MAYRINESFESTTINVQSTKCDESPYRIIHLPNLINKLDPYLGLYLEEHSKVGLVVKLCNYCNKSKMQLYQSSKYVERKIAAQSNCQTLDKRQEKKY